LEYYAIESPLAQPRNAIFGQLISAVIGVSICKLFALSPNFASIQWIGGALACATATALMALTKTVHPPAGATALLAVVDHVAVGLGWSLVPLVLLGCTIMLATALLVNNIQRRFPIYWWTPEDLGQRRRIRFEKEAASEPTSLEDGEAKRVPQIVITSGLVTVPPHMLLSQEEKQLLEVLSDRI